MDRWPLSESIPAIVVPEMCPQHPTPQCAVVDRGALRSIGNAARGIKTLAGKVNEATGGAAGMAWNAAKAHPTFGKFAMGAEGALNAAIRGSDTGLKAIDIGERATQVRDVASAKSVYDDARSLRKNLRP